MPLLKYTAKSWYQLILTSKTGAPSLSVSSVSWRRAFFEPGGWTCWEHGLTRCVVRAFVSNVHIICRFTHIIIKVFGEQCSDPPTTF